MYRLSKDQAKKLRAISEITGLPQAQLVRTAIDALSKVWEAKGQKLTLPLEFELKEPPVTSFADDVVKYKVRKPKTEA